jgi:hypothetical protein
MSTEENKAVVRRELEELYNEGGNLDAAEEVYAPDFVGHEPAVGDIRGVEGAKQYAATMPRNASRPDQPRPRGVENKAGRSPALLSCRVGRKSYIRAPSPCIG